MSDDQQSFIKSPRQLITIIVLAFLVPVIVMVAIANLINTTTRTGAGADAMTPEAIAKRIAPVGHLIVAGDPEAAAEAEAATKAAADQAAKVAEAAQATAATAAAAAAAATAATAAAATEAAAPAGSPAAAEPAAGTAAASGGGSSGATFDLAAGEKVYNGTCGVCHNSGVAGAPKHGDAKAWKPRLEQGIATLDKHAIEGIRAMPPRGGNGKLTDDELRNAVAYMIEAVK